MRSLHFLPAASEAAVEVAEARGLFLCNVAGFFLAFKVCLTFLFFRSNPQLGTAATIAATLCWLLIVVFYRVLNPPAQSQHAIWGRPLHWIAIYLGLAATSLIWTTTNSMAVATGYWSAMAADVATIYLLLSYEPVECNAVRVMHGFISGAAVVAVIAWAIPPMDDMRLGHEEFLHPNAIGFEFAIATLLVIYLAQRKRAWAWIACGFTVTLIRTLSKAAIVGFLFAGLYYFIRGLKIGNRARFYIGLFSTGVIISFWGLLEGYLDLYTRGDNVDTLTGRTYIWTQALEIALEKPWLGHGFYAFRWIVPPFDDFQAWQAHNEVLQQFFAYGIVGVIVVCGIYWTFYRQIRISTHAGMRSLAMAMLILMLVRGLVDTDRFELCFPLWLMTMLSITLTRSPLPVYSR
jgi:exopolysaccharide production protein ExoQ